MFCQAGASVRIRLLPVFRRFRRSPVISNLRSRSGLSRSTHSPARRSRTVGWHSSAVLDSANPYRRSSSRVGSDLLDLTWAADGKALYVVAGIRAAHVLLHVNLQGNARILWRSSGASGETLAYPPRWSPSGYSELGSKWQYVDDGKFLTPTYACRILLLAGHALPRIAAGP